MSEPEDHIQEHIQDHIHYGKATDATSAISTRRSIRAFTDREVSDDVIKQILSTASRAPSGTNIQPWQVHVVKGDKRDRLCELVCEAFDEDASAHTGEMPYYPEKWFEPYLARRRKIGWDLYSLLGIKKGEREKTHTQHKRNFQLFDAPVGMIFTIHRDLSTGSWMDYGMFLQNIMVLAREAGLHTCPQAAWCDFHKVIRPVLGLSDDEMVVCGMALGYADENAIENTLVSEREPLEAFVKFQQ